MVLDGRYRIGACIGVGGTGVVFEARRLDDGETVVVKTMRPVFAYNADLCRRLRRETEVARAVEHAGIVPVLDEGMLPDGSPYLVMKKLRGESLARLLLRDTMIDDSTTAAITIRVASILHAVHGRAYVHRDVKPEHILFDRTPDGTLDVCLLDFGVCAAPTAPEDERNRERGRVYGTPTYVSPEQAMGNPDVDGRADVFGLGIVMFECLSGRVPFTASNVAALLRRIIREDAPRVGLVAPHVSREMDMVVAKCLERVPDQRFPTMRALARSLVPLAGGRLETERRLAARVAIGAAAAPDASETAREVAA
jgi:serine/threonine-protein kinase